LSDVLLGPRPSLPNLRRRQVLVVRLVHRYYGAVRLLLNVLLLLKQIEVYGVSTAFGTFGSFKALSDYAAATGGDVYPGTSTKSIETAFNRIVEEARYQYVLGYVSNNRAEAATFRTITVTTRNGKYKVIHRRGYTQYPVQ